jgi:hypothetical protein
MGASGWHYFVPYQSEMDKALQELREEVFNKGEYGEEYFDSVATSEIENGEMAKKFPHIPVELIETYKKELQAIQKIYPSPNKRRKPKTIAALLKQSGEEGTHSIIDIQGVSETPDFGKVTPLPSAYLTQFFGMENPTREMIEQKINEIQALCERWQGFYLIVFQDNTPQQILFVGVSGD